MSTCFISTERLFVGLLPVIFVRGGGSDDDDDDDDDDNNEDEVVVHATNGEAGTISPQLDGGGTGSGGCCNSGGLGDRFGTTTSCRWNFISFVVLGRTLVVHTTTTLWSVLFGTSCVRSITLFASISSLLSSSAFCIWPCTMAISCTIKSSG